MKETRAKQAMRHYMETGKQLEYDKNAPKTSRKAICIHPEMIDLFEKRYRAYLYGTREEQDSYSYAKIADKLSKLPDLQDKPSPKTVERYYKEYKELKDEIASKVEVVESDDSHKQSTLTDHVKDTTSQSMENPTMEYLMEEIQALKKQISTNNMIINNLLERVTTQQLTIDTTTSKLQLLPAPITTPLAGYSIEQLNVFAQEWLSIMSKQPPIIKSIFLADNEYYNQRNNLFDTLTMNIDIPERYGITHIDKDKLELLDTAYTSKTHPESLVLQHFSSMKKFKKYLERYIQYRQLPFLESRNTQLSCTNEKFQLAFLATKHELGS